MMKEREKMKRERETFSEKEEDDRKRMARRK